MNTILPKRLSGVFIHGLIFSLPFLVLITNAGVGLCSFAFLLAALAGWRAARAPLRRHLNEIRAVLIAFGLSFAYALGQFLLRHDVALRTLEKPVRTLAALSVLVVLLAWRPSRKALWWGLIAGTVASAGFVVYQRWGLGMDRPGGLINSITFGDTVLCMGLLCMAALGDFKGRQALWPALGTAAGLLGSIATGTRGGWLAIVLAVLVLLRHGPELQRPRRKRVAAAVLGLLLASFLVPQTGARLRLEQGISDVENYFSGAEAYTNMGVRLELWKSALLLSEQHPWLGASRPQVKAELQQLADAGQIAPFVLKVEHFHNEMLQTLVFGGVPGLLIWLATVLAPLRFFLRRLGQQAASTPALAGAVLVLSYFSFGLTEVIFWSVRSNMFYAMMLFLLAGLCLNAKEESR